MSQDTPSTDPPPRTGRNRRQSRQLSGIQIMFASVLAIGMVLAITLSSRIAANQPLYAYRNSVETEVVRLQQQEATLRAELDYAQSDAYVEQWAVGEGRMIRPGEVLVVIIGAPRDESIPTEAPPVIEIDTLPPEPDNWELWWRLFFDSPPPEL